MVNSDVCASSPPAERVRTWFAALTVALTAIEWWASSRAPDTRVTSGY